MYKWTLYFSAVSLRAALGLWAKTPGVALYMPEREPSLTLEVVELQITLETEEPRSRLARFWGSTHYTGEGVLNKITLHELHLGERGDFRTFLPPGAPRSRSFSVRLQLDSEVARELLELLNKLCYPNWAEIISKKGQPKSVVLQGIRSGYLGTVESVSIELCPSGP